MNMNRVICKWLTTIGDGSPWLVFLVGLLITCLNWIAADFGCVTHWMVLWTGLAVSLLLWIAVRSVDETRKKLQLQEQRYHGVFEATSDAMVIFDQHGTIIDANSAVAMMYGRSREESIGKDARELMRPENVHYLEQMLRNIDTHNMFYGEAVAAKWDQSLFEVEFHGVPFALSDQPHLLVISRDITERKRTERDLRNYAQALEGANRSLEEYSAKVEAATRAKSGFLADMSHEIRTPLTAILGFAEFLRHDGDMVNAPPSRVEAIETILRNGDHLLRLINDLLDLSKIEAGRFEIESVPCSVVEIISRVQEIMESKVKEKKLSLAVKILGAIPKTIQTDPTRVHQILLNLLSNAVKFTQVGGIRLEVRLSNDASMPSNLEFSVIDSGIGMNEEQVTKLFQPFIQADSSITGRFGGTGLGLSVSRKLAKLLGGDIHVSSVYGKGSTFVLELPTGSLENVPMIETIHSEVEHHPTNLPDNTADFHLSARVLLAEDGPDNQRLISLILRKAGAEVITVDHGQAAVECAMSAWLDKQPFDVILMDMHMPILDGYGAVRKLRQAGYTYPIFALTAEAMQEDRKKCLSAGCDDYASKPIQRDALLSLVANAVKNREAASS
jgi:PAS domain S-box-containing protein